MRRALALALLLTGCPSEPTTDAGTDAPALPPDAPTVDWPLSEVPASHTLEGDVVRDVLRVPAPSPPPNPLSGVPTPAELDFTQIARYHRAGATEARAIVLAMPGFLGGAGSFDRLARELVRLGGTDPAPIEVWAIDRRSNLLEDLRGLDAAEAEGNPDIAKGYYFGSDTVGGEPFAGFLDGADAAYASEWGLSTHVNDLRALIERVPAADRVGHVFLLGHSLGGTFAETFAAWRFEDGVRGAELLAGVILVDGSQSETPSSETDYRDGTTGGFMPSPGVNGTREGQVFVELPILGVGVYASAEILSLEAQVAPDAVVEDRDRERLLATLLGLSMAEVPPMTNEAALGWGFDAASNGLSFAAVSCGAAMGGPTEEYDSLLGARLIHPSDRMATYSWIDAPDATPAEHTPIASLAASWVLGRTNFAEWYFPQRLPIDLGAVAGLAVTDGSWQAAEGLRAFDGALMDAPVLAIAAGLRSVDSYAASRMRGAPIGPGRPHAGTARTDELAYRIVDATFMTHIDPLTAPDSPENPVPDAILAFVAEHVAPGATTPTLP